MVLSHYSIISLQNYFLWLILEVNDYVCGYYSLARATLLEKSLVTLAVFPCAGVGMLTPRSYWSSHMIARLITYLSRLYPYNYPAGKVYLFWLNESCTKKCIHSSNPEDTGYIDTMAKT